MVKIFPPRLHSPRRRGAQPCNSNALRHGLYARRNSTPLASGLHPYFNLQSTCPWISTGKISTSLPSAIGDPKFLDQRLRSTQESLRAYLLAGPPDPQDFRKYLSWQRPVLAALRSIQRQAFVSAGLHRSRADLTLAAEQPLRLIALSLAASGISCDIENCNYTVPTQTQAASPLADRTSGSLQNAPNFLTDAQWEIIRPLLPPIHNQKSTIRNLQSPRGRPPADPRLLLDAIFWKLAFHARWRDITRPPSPLPLGGWAVGEPPSMLTCRRYYTRLFNSGRLLSLLSALNRHFRSATGSSDLVPFLERGCFVYRDHAISLAPGLVRDWRSRTALLFFQLAFQSLQSFYRRQDRQDRRPHPYLRLPRLKKDYSLALTSFLLPAEQHSFQKIVQTGDFYSSHRLAGILDRPLSARDDRLHPAHTAPGPPVL